MLSHKKDIFFNGSKMPDSKMVREFEKLHYVMLPKAFKDIVRKQDGGWFAENSLDITDPFVGASSTFVCSKLMSFLDGTMSNMNNDGFYPGYIHFALDDCGRLFSFDYTENKSERDPDVVLICPERPLEYNRLKISNSFNSFLDMIG